MKTAIAHQQQNKVLIKKQHLREAQDNLSLCAGKPYCSKSQLSSLRLFIEDLKQELKRIQALCSHSDEHLGIAVLIANPGSNFGAIQQAGWCHERS